MEHGVNEESMMHCFISDELQENYVIQQAIQLVKFTDPEPYARLPAGIAAA